MSAIISRINNIRKSPEDKREYRGIELSNKLRILLVSDPDADKAAAAMTVGVGYLMDPWELPGLAHFCEHMLFLGTDKFPVENEYKKFISENAGSLNASTAADRTNYHFNIKPDKLYDILDRFVEFFVCPLFTESATEREVCAVDSEFKNYLTNDMRRNMQVDRFLSKPGHDYGKFSTGNKQTLFDDAKEKGIEPREALLKFHEQCMTCAISGRETLDELENYINKLEFSRIENKNVDLRKWTESPYGCDQLGKKIHVVPIKDTRSLRVTFPIPCFDCEYKSKPGLYLGHIIGYEGPGSLQSDMKKRGWTGHSVVAGEQRRARGMSVFYVEVNLSAEGLEHIEQIIELIFQCIGMVRRAGYQNWISDELRDTKDIQFRFKNKEGPVAYVQDLADHLLVRPFEDILCHRHVIFEHKPELVEKILACLTPDNMMYRIVAQKFQGDPDNTKEPIYGIEMCITNMEEDALKKFSTAMETPNAAFHMPEKNKYIASHFDLKPREEFVLHPQIIRDDKWLRCWYKQDDEFNLPKMECKIKIFAPVLRGSPQRMIETTLFVLCFNDALTEETYVARLAGLSFQISANSSGIRIKVTGFNEKLPLFAKYIIDRLVNFKPDPLRFNVLFDSLKKALENVVHLSPYALTVGYLSHLLSEHHWSNHQLLAVSKDIKVDNVNNIISKLLNAFYIQMFCYGNTTKQEVLDLTEIVLTKLKCVTSCRPIFRNEYLPFRIHALENGDNYLYRQFQSTHDVSAVKVLFQVGVQNNYDTTMVQLIGQIMKEPAATQLRTVEQLGYTVWSGAELQTGTLGLYVYVQGQKEPDHVLDRIDAFLFKFREEVEIMAAEEFQANVGALLCRLKVQPKTIYKRFDRWDYKIKERRFDFDRRCTQIDVLQKITKDELLAFYDRKFVKDAPERRKMSVLLHGKNHSLYSSKEYRIKREENITDSKSLEAPEEIECVERLRDSLSLYGRPTPKLNIPPVGVHILSTNSK